MYMFYFKLPWSSMFASNPKARSRNIYECCGGISCCLRWGGLIRSLGCRDSMFLAPYSLYFWERIQRSLVESSFSPAPVTQWVNAGLKSHWLILSDCNANIEVSLLVFDGVCVSKHLIYPRTSSLETESDTLQHKPPEHALNHTINIIHYKCMNAQLITVFNLKEDLILAD